jgi:murein DD-endopeptidase MepM/ murein hydrolase activator NlpD
MSFDPLDETNPSRPFQEPPIHADDTNPSVVVRHARLAQEEPHPHAEDTNPAPLEDTAPSLVMRRVNTRSTWRQAVGVLSLLGASLFTLATVWLMWADASQVPPPPTLAATSEVNLLPSPTTLDPTVDASPVNDADLPTLAPDFLASILAQPLVTPTGDPLEITANRFDPFTIIPDRPRNEVIQYTVKSGDTIEGIATQFNLKPESIVWANGAGIVESLPIGITLYIPPIDGVLYEHVGSKTLQEIASEYDLPDAYAIINSEYNTPLRGYFPNDVPPSGALLMLAGAQAYEVSFYDPVIVTEGGDAGATGTYVTFAPGEAGSCARVQNPGGGAFWTPPLNSYTWIRGFSGYHTGVDLAASVGTPISASNSGRVIFSGWNSWGYGYMVALAHGPFTSIYGHMSVVYVACGQDVGAGAIIGAVGNSGNSSGPHLHFEIRYNNQPQDPTISLAF